MARKVKARTAAERDARDVIRVRSGERCEMCGGPPGSASHRRPASQRGTWSPSNLLVACGTGTTGCHGWLESHREAADAGGWQVMHPDEGTTSADYLVWLPRYGGWVALDDEGGVALAVGAGPGPVLVPPGMAVAFPERLDM